MSVTPDPIQMTPIYFGNEEPLSNTARISIRADDSMKGTNLFEFSPKDAISIQGNPEDSRSSFYFSMMEIDDGYPEHNRVFSLGWNLDAGGSAKINGKRAIGHAIEGSYLDGGFCEAQMRYLDTEGYQYRLYAMTLSGDVNPHVDWYFTASQFDLRKPLTGGVVDSFFTVNYGGAIVGTGVDFNLRNSQGQSRASIIVNDPQYQGYASFTSLALGEGLSSLGQGKGTIRTKSDPTGDTPFLRNIAIPANGGALEKAQVDFVWTNLAGVPGMYIRSVSKHAVGISGHGISTPVIKFHPEDDYLHLGRQAGQIDVKLYASEADTLEIVNGNLSVGKFWKANSVGEVVSKAYKVSDGYTKFTSGSGGYHSLWLRTRAEGTGYGQYYSVDRATNISGTTGFPNGAFAWETEFLASSGKIFSFRNNGANIASGYHNGVVELSKLNVSGHSSATTLGTVTQKIPFYDKNGNMVGFIPVYNTIN